MIARQRSGHLGIILLRHLLHTLFIGQNLLADDSIARNSGGGTTEQLELAEKKNRAYRTEVHQAAKDFWHLSSCHDSEYAPRRRDQILERAVDIDCGKGI
jgi:hypothetical protein